METNEIRKGKYSKIILKEKKLQKRRKQIKRENKKNIKLIIMKKNPIWKKNEVCLLSPNFKLACK